MSEAKFIQAIMRRVPGAEVLDAVTSGVDAATGEQHIGIYLSSALAGGISRIKAFRSLLDYGYNIDATEEQKRRPLWRPQLLATIVRDCEKNPVTPAEAGDSDLRTSIERVVKVDDVEAFMALDKVGLIDREPPYELMKMRVGALTRYFSHAIATNASRCNQYLLATSSGHLMPSFPNEERMWPKDLEMARDLVFQIPDADLEKSIVVLADIEAPEGARRNEIREQAEEVVMAMLERSAELTQGALSVAGERLLQGAIVRSVDGRGNGMGKKAEFILIDVLRMVKRLDTKEAFQIAVRVLEADKQGRVDLAPATLKRLIDSGLPVQSAPGWYADGLVVPLISVAGAKHFDLLSDHVPDKVAFMRHFGPEVAMSHSNETDHKAGGLRGSENHELVRLAELGFPLGPIDVTAEDGSTVALALYERIVGYHASKAADSFVVGHLMGHLSAEHVYDGVGPMHVAVAYKSPETVVALAKAGLPLDDICSSTVRSYDASQRRAFHQYKGMTPLIMALKVESVDDSAKLVRALVDSGADTSIKAPTGASPTQLAKTPEMKALLRAGKIVHSLNSAILGDQQAAQKPARKKASPGML